MSMVEVASLENRSAQSVWVSHDRVAPIIDPSKAKGRVAMAMRLAGDMYGVTVDQILNRRRFSQIVQCRQFAMLVAYNMGVSYTDIGLHMDRDHTTVSHGVGAAKARLDELTKEAETPIFKTTRKTQ